MQVYRIDSHILTDLKLDFTAFGSLIINQMQKETLLKMLGWHRLSNDSQQIYSELLCLYCMSICLLILGILITQIHLSREPSLALEFFVLLNTTQNTF